MGRQGAGHGSGSWECAGLTVRREGVFPMWELQNSPQLLCGCHCLLCSPQLLLLEQQHQGVSALVAAAARAMLWGISCYWVADPTGLGIMFVPLLSEHLVLVDCSSIPSYAADLGFEVQVQKRLRFWLCDTFMAIRMTALEIEASLLIFRTVWTKPFGMCAIY